MFDYLFDEPRFYIEPFARYFQRAAGPLVRAVSTPAAKIGCVLSEKFKHRSLRIECLSPPNRRPHTRN
jgi:hypothetical protein